MRCQPQPPRAGNRGLAQASSETLVDPSAPALGFVRIRVGMHCGPATGTVIGTLRPKYTLLGDTARPTNPPRPTRPTRPPGLPLCGLRPILGHPKSDSQYFLAWLRPMRLREIETPPIAAVD